MNPRKSTRRGTARQLALWGLGLSVSWGTAVAAPQRAAQPQAQPELQEVVVTAQKRRQNIQNVPIAISAFTSQQLRQQGVTNLAQLSAQTPGVTLSGGAPFAGDNSVLSASIRGIGQSDFAININPAVGVYLDGVYLGMSVGANVNLLDVSRVEIDKGPQGTLFGANTIGGAISIITHTPGEKPRFIAEATGGSFDRRDLAFTTDIPIIPHKLLSSFTFGTQNQNGWQNVIPYPANSPYAQTPYVTDPQTAYPEPPGYTTGGTYGGDGVTSMRGKMLWFATNNLKFTFTGDWTHESQSAMPNVVVGTFSGNLLSATFSSLYNLCISNDAASLPGAIAAATTVPGIGPIFPVGSANNGLFGGVCSQPRGHVPGLSVGGAPLLGAGYVGGPPGPYNYTNHPGTAYLGSSDPRIYLSSAANNTGNIDTTYGFGPDFAHNDIFGFSVTGDYDINDDLHLKSITGYRQLRWRIGTELDGTPETLFQVADAQHQWQISQELQLLGRALQGKLNYVTGLYYFKESGYVHDYVPFEGILQVYDVANDAQNVNYAAYFHADYDPTAHWGFTVGGRYTDAQAYFLAGQSDLNSFPLGSALYPVVTGQPFLRYIPGIPDSQQWHIFDPTGSIQYHFTHDIMAYVSWSKGFMAGGWTTRVSAPITSPKQAEYGPETSKAWELGLKSSWFNRHLIVNTDVFDTSFDAIQLNVQHGASPTLVNAGNAKILGWELQAQSLVGETGLELNGSASYLDAYYTYVNPAANIPEYALPDGTTVCPGGSLAGCTISLGGSPLEAKLPKTPRWKFIFDPTYTYVMTSQAELRFIPVFTYTTSMFNDSLNTPQMWRPVTRNLAASIHYVSPSGEYDVAVGGTNLTNDRYIMSGQPNYAAGFIDAYYNAPREWYVTLRVEMGE
jgi:iron complex outermembrane receptor protein